jgi:ATP-dependent 26S proteasome regulatory subunit
METVILKDGLRKLIKDDIQLFLQSEDWYKCRGIPYKRGYLFHGSPGTGKTSMIKAISTYCKRHMHYLDLSNVRDNNQLIDLF